MKNLFTLLICISLNGLAYAQPKPVEVTVKGQGVPVLFLPGFTCAGSVWDETIAQLPEGFQTHQVTYAGFNHLQPIPMPWYPALKEALKKYIIDQNLQDVCLVGHSMGGNLATELAAEMPERVSKILLAEAIPCMRELMMPGVSADMIAYDAPYNKQMLQMDSLAQRQYATMMAANMTNNKAGADTIIQWMLMADRETYVYGYVDLLKLDLRDKLPQIKAEVLILGASFPDAAVVKSNYEKQYAKLVKKEMAFASNSKHFLMYDEPTWFYGQINTFLKK